MSGSKRVKHVYRQSEVAHRFAHPRYDGDYARSSDGRVYWDGDTIYSYGSHFPMARRVKLKGGDVFLITTRTYSHSTAGHLSDVRCALRGQDNFFVPDVQANYKAAHRANVKARIKKAGALRAKGLLAISPYNVQRNLDQAAIVGENMREYAKAFKLGVIKELRAFPSMAECAQLAIDRNAAVAARNADPKRAAKLEKARAARIVALQRKHAGVLAAWREGEIVYLPRKAGMALRVCPRDPSSIQTSWGATVPLDKAVVAFRLAQACRMNQRRLVPTRGEIDLGGYPLDFITEAGEIHAGCHVIPFAEAELLAKKIGVI